MFFLNASIAIEKKHGRSPCAARSALRVSMSGFGSGFTGGFAFLGTVFWGIWAGLCLQSLNGVRQGMAQFVDEQGGITNRHVFAGLGNLQDAIVHVR